jgi:crossover junction endodeoxyribonuclease RuvC
VTHRGSPEPSSTAGRLSILGIDPGSRATGWGLLGGDRSRPSLLECGIIRLYGADDLPSRLAALQAELATLVARLGPESAAVESPFHGKNSASALQLAHARGVILAVLAASGLSVATYTPATVKKSVTGNGRAPKDQVQRMVDLMLGAPAKSRPNDVTDALAVALCHAATSGYRARVVRATRPATAKADR